MPDRAQSLDAIIAEIRQQSADEVTAVQQSAAREQEQINQRAKVEADRLRGGIVRKAKTQAATLQKRTAAIANLEVKKLNLQSQSLISAEIRRRLDERLAEFRQTPEYVHLLKNLVTEGATGLGVENVIIFAGDRERALLTTEFLESIGREIASNLHFSISDEILTESGVILYSDDRRMRFDNRLATRCRRIFTENQWSIMQAFTDNEEQR
ncbi:MAG: V-type ATP synthase subunit E family protein [Candidatus Neomarinimicrobiota bacterium]